MSSHDTIFYGGDIITMDEELPKAEAVAILDKVILSVGSVETVFALATENTKFIFLNKQTLMPGFIDPHQHAVTSAEMRATFVNIGALEWDKRPTYQDVHDKMINTIDGLQDCDWGLFFAWDPELIPTLPKLSATFLDENISSKYPIFVVGQSGHIAWVNTLALLKAGITDTTEQPDGGTIVKDPETGQPTGQLLEEPALMLVMKVIPPPSADVLDHAFTEQWKIYASAGLTTVTSMWYMPTKALDTLLTKHASAETFPIRIGLYRLENATKNNAPNPLKAIQPKVHGCCPKLTTFRSEKTLEDDDGIGNFSPRLWEVGIKLVADGSPHCGTAAVNEPYKNTPLTETLGFPPAPTYGTLNMDTEALLDTVTRYDSQNKQMAIHAQGERAVEQVLKVYEQVIPNSANKDMRHRMEHLGLMTPEQIARAGKLDLGLSFFVDHLRFYGLIYKTDIFGDRVNRWTPLSEATKNNITWTIHQDNPGLPGDPNPLANLTSAITRCTRDDPTTPYGPEYRVSVHEALKAITINAAWQIHRDNDIGSIKEGKLADFVVLSENPYEKDPSRMDEINIIETYVDGCGNNLSDLHKISPFGNMFMFVTHEKTPY